MVLDTIRNRRELERWRKHFELAVKCLATEDTHGPAIVKSAAAMADEMILQDRKRSVLYKETKDEAKSKSLDQAD